MTTEKILTIDLSPLDYTDPLVLLEQAYSREGPRRVLLVVEWEARRITAETRDPSTEGIPEYRWHGREDAYPLDPLIDATALRVWVETEVLPHALPLFAAYRREWDGDNWIGAFPGHEAEKEEFDGWVGHQDPPLLQGESAGLWDVRDWLVDIPEGLRADSTDSALDALADEIAAEVRRENIVLIGDVVAHLTEIRDEMQEAAPASPENCY